MTSSVQRAPSSALKLGVAVTVTEAAKALGVSRKTLSFLLNEHAGVSPAMAYRLARAFSTSPDLWLSLQKQRDLWEARDTDLSEVRTLVAAG